MMIRQVEPAEIFTGPEFVPQAVITRPPSYFERRFGWRFVENSDDLDTYRIAALNTVRFRLLSG